MVKATHTEKRFMQNIRVGMSFAELKGELWEIDHPTIDFEMWFGIFDWRMIRKMVKKLNPDVDYKAIKSDLENHNCADNMITQLDIDWEHLEQVFNKHKITESEQNGKPDSEETNEVD